jgi:hypothetical protein
MYNREKMPKFAAEYKLPLIYESNLISISIHCNQSLNDGPSG